MFTVYILYSKTFDRYYVGQCEDIIAIVARHNNKAVPSTKAFTPWTLMHTENYQTRAASMQRETEIKKKKSRRYIEFLISNSGTDNHVPM